MTRLLPDLDPPRLSRMLLALLAASLVAASSSGNAIPSRTDLQQQQHHRYLRVFGRDDRVQVPSASSSSPYSAVGLLQWNAETLCTASLVADAIVVTAAECVLDSTGDLLAPDTDQQPVFFPGVIDSSISSLEQSTFGLKAHVITVHKQSDYWVKWTGNTYVLLELDSPLGATVGKLGLPALGELDPQLEKTPVQMVSYRIGDSSGDSAAIMSYQSCTCRFPVAFNGAQYLIHHDCDATATGSPGSPLLVNYSSTETYIIGIHFNAVGDGSQLEGTTFATYNDDVANRGVLTPYIQQHLSYLVAQTTSGSGSVSTDDATSSHNMDGTSSGQGGAASSAASEDQATADASSSQATQATDSSSSTSSFLDPAVAVVCIGFVGVAWACIVFIATRRSRRHAETPEPLIDGEQ